MEYRFYNDSMKNYLVISCSDTRKPDQPETDAFANTAEDEEAIGYQYQMISANRISGLLPCSLRRINGELLLYVDITSLQSMDSLFRSRKITGEIQKKILYSLTDTGESISRFLLDCRRLLSDPRFVFYSYARDAWYFVYYPKEEKGDYHALFQFMADRTEPTDKMAAAVIYQLCDLAGSRHFVLNSQLLDHLYEAGQGRNIRESASEAFYERNTRVNPRMETPQGTTFQEQGAYYEELREPGGHYEEPGKTAGYYGESRKPAGYYEEPGEQNGHYEGFNAQAPYRDAKSHMSDVQNAAYSGGLDNNAYESALNRTTTSPASADQENQLSRTLIFAFVCLAAAAGAQFLHVRFQLQDTADLVARSVAAVGLAGCILLTVYGVYLAWKRKKENQRMADDSGQPRMQQTLDFRNGQLSGGIMMGASPQSPQYTQAWQSPGEHPYNYDRGGSARDGRIRGGANYFKCQ